MSVNRHFPKTSVRLRRLTYTRGAVDVAMDVLHLRLDVLQAARAIQQRLRMLGKLRVRQIRRDIARVYTEQTARAAKAEVK